MIIKTSIEGWMEIKGTEGARLLAQTSSIKVCETSTLPNATHEIIDDIPQDVMQTVHPGRFGQYMTLQQIQLVSIYIAALTPEEVEASPTFEVLELRYKNKQLQGEVDTLAYEILVLKGVI